jgi:hypothetical protein
MNDDQDDDMWWSGETTPSRMMSRFRSYSLIACGACQAASLFVNECSPSFHFVMCSRAVISVLPQCLSILQRMESALRKDRMAFLSSSSDLTLTVFIV